MLRAGDLPREQPRLLFEVDNIARQAWPRFWRDQLLVAGRDDARACVRAYRLPGGSLHRAVCRSKPARCWEHGFPSGRLPVFQLDGRCAGSLSFEGEVLLCDGMPLLLFANGSVMDPAVGRAAVFGRGP